MKYAVVYSSMTGNTAELATAIKNKLGECYFGNPSEEALAADIIFIGFWATRNSCSPDIKTFIEQLSNKKLFLFGTAGYQNSKEYFDEIIGNVTACVPESNTIIGTYMCQGKVSASMQVKIKEAKPEMYASIKGNLADAESHPNKADIKELLDQIEKLSL